MSELAFPPPFTGEVSRAILGARQRGAVRDDETKSRNFAKVLRARLTTAELILWSRLRLRRAHGRSFRRQHPIGPYVADFACAAARVVIEVDGETHGSDAEIAHDHRRDAYLRARGWRVIRVTNEEVYKNLANLLDMIFEEAPPSVVPSLSLGSDTSPVNGGGKRAR